MKPGSLHLDSTHSHGRTRWESLRPRWRRPSGPQPQASREAEKICRSAQDPGPEVTLAELAARLTAAEPDRARCLADEAERLARGDVRTQSVAIPVELAEAMAHAGHYELAELISRLLAPGMQARATGELAAALARAGEYERAEQLIGGITGSRGWSAVKLAAALAHAGEYDRAERLTSTITGYRTLSVAKRELSTALSEGGELDRAERLARTIAKPWHRNVALGEVAVALARSGQADRAAEIARSIGSVWALLDISVALARSGDPRPSRLADEVEALARTEGTEAQITLLGRLGVALADADPDRARRLADEAEQIAAATTDPESRASALQRLAEVAASSGDYDRAEQIVGTIASRRLKAQALVDLAVALAEGAPGRAAALTDQAGQLAATLPDADIKAAAMLHIAKALAEPPHLPAVLREYACRFLALSLARNSSWQKSLAVLAKLPALGIARCRPSAPFKRQELLSQRYRLDPLAAVPAQRPEDDQAVVLPVPAWWLAARSSLEAGCAGSSNPSATRVPKREHGREDSGYQLIALSGFELVMAGGQGAAGA